MPTRILTLIMLTTFLGFNTFAGTTFICTEDARQGRSQKIVELKPTELGLLLTYSKVSIDSDGYKKTKSIAVYVDCIGDMADNKLISCNEHQTTAKKNILNLQQQNKFYNAIQYVANLKLQKEEQIIFEENECKFEAI